MLKLGSKSAAVKKLVNYLRAKGYLQSLDIDLSDDAIIFDLPIQDAVKEFQKDNKISVDGVVGPETWQYLYGEGKLLEYLFIHCSATREGLDLTGDDILRMHTSPTRLGGRGWRKPGYSRVFQLDGSVDILNEYDNNAFVSANEITNGALRYNHNSVHICYIGGISKAGDFKDTRTLSQLEAMRVFVVDFIRKFPNVKVVGHHQTANKGCPCFWVPDWAKYIGLEDKNIKLDVDISNLEYYKNTFSGVEKYAAWLR